MTHNAYKYTDYRLFFLQFLFIFHYKQENLLRKKNKKKKQTVNECMKIKFNTAADAYFAAVPDYAFSAAASSSPPLVLRV